jgi:ribosomal protein S18
MSGCLGEKAFENPTKGLCFRTSIRNLLQVLIADVNIGKMTRDTSLDNLLYLDGVSYVVDGPFWVKFEVRQVPESPEKPHGLDYSLTLHDGDGQRILGFDNAHAIKEGSGPGAKTRIEYDHTHKGERVRFYDYTDAATLLSDFWTEADKILEERITKP